MARAVTKTPKHNHIKPFLKIYTGYQPVKQRFAFKLDLLMYKTLHAGQPQYLNSMLITQNIIIQQDLTNSLLNVQRTRIETGKRAFSVTSSSF